MTFVSHNSRLESSKEEADTVRSSSPSRSVPSRQASAENESRNAHDEARSVELSFTETADPKQNSNLTISESELEPDQSEPESDDNTKQNSNLMVSNHTNSACIGCLCDCVCILRLRRKAASA